MYYLLFLLLGYFVFCSFEIQYIKNNYITICTYLCPFIGLWIFFVGGQYNVGTDYSNYLEYFLGKWNIDFFADRNEYVFSSIIKLFQHIGIYGQFYFYLFAAISVFLYIQIARRVTNSHYALFFFLFITISTLFHSQMNGLRQCTAVYFVTLSFIEFLFKRRFVSLGLALIALGFHTSVIALFPFYLFIGKVSFSPSIAKLLILLTSVLSFCSFDDIIVFIVSLFPKYEHYIESEYIQKEISMLNKLTKLVYLPIYYCSISTLKMGKLTRMELRLFQIGLLAYFLKNLSLVSILSTRFSYYFFILSILPIFYYLRVLEEKNKRLYVFICIYIFLLYLLKVLVFPSGEYKYESIFSTYF